MKYRSGYVLNEAEKKTLWQAIEAIAAKLSVPTDRPKLTFQAADIRDFGPNSVLVLRFLREDQRGSFVWTVFGFFGDQHIVTLEHAGTSADGEEGLRGLEAMAASFRFE